MAKIKILDKITSNQIAAGEVVERPVSVIKELVENSIDAGSSRVDIKILGGGLKEITVTDNGEGMSREDLPLALSRHATSKIGTAQDLEKLQTLGFRGEALPSIASISRLSIITRLENDLSGTLLQAEGGEIQGVSDIGSPAGTLIKVSDLFFNTPGRLKFIKSASRETTRISNLVYRLAMAFPSISFALTIEGRKVFSSSGNGNLLGVIAEVYGLNNIDSFIEYHYKGNHLEAEGYLAKPVYCRNNKYHQTFFVNRRYVQNHLLNKAVEEAYYTLLPKDRYPVSIINVSMNPALVDANVHPTKKQVRFFGENEVFTALKDSIHKTLSENNLISRFSFPISTYKTPSYEETRQERLHKFPFKQMNEAQNEYTMFSGKQDIAIIGSKDEKPPEERRIIGQFAKSYILYQDNDDNIVFMDQHAAHERILYKQFKEKESSSKRVQQVIPNVIEIDRDLTSSFREKLEGFKETGFHFEEFGNNTFMLRAIPAFMHNIYTANLIRDMIEEILREDTNQSEISVKEAIYKVMACKAAVKANETLTEAEMEAIVQQFDECRSFSCPHGRPAVLEIPKGEIAKKFLRSS